MDRKIGYIILLKCPSFITDMDPQKSATPIINIIGKS